MTLTVSMKGMASICTKAFTALLWMFFFFNTGAEGQTTFSWRNDQNPPNNASWISTTPYYFWIGSEAIPGGSEILFFDGDRGTTMTNNLTATNRYRIVFGPNNAVSRTINGATANTFFDFSGNPPAIFNGSGVNHTINFPIVNGNANGANRLEFNADNGNLTIGSTISGNGATRNIVGMGNNSVFFNGVISNGGATVNFIKEGTGSVSFNASNTYTGTTTVTGGTLTLNASASLPASNTVTINGGNLQINHPTALSTSNAVALTNGTLSVGTAPTGTVNVGALAISPGTAINLGTGANTFNLTIASTSGLGSGNLTINNWSPSYGKRIFITDITHINNTAVLDRINFNGFGVGAKLINTNELVPKFLYYTNAAGSGLYSDGGSWLNGAPSLIDGTETVYVQPGYTLTINTSALNFLKIFNAGTLIIGGPHSIITPNLANAGFENTGTLTMNTGSVITIGNGATFLNSGSITMSPVATINMNAGSIWAGNGTFIGGDGILNFTSTGTITSTSTLPNVRIAGNVNFNTCTIGTSLEIRAGGAVTPNAPFYATGSTLIYDVSGTYNRTTEWGSNAGQGYPHHVRVTGGTTLNLNNNPISASAFGIGGDLTVQSGATLNTGPLDLNPSGKTSFTINGNADIAGIFSAAGLNGGDNDIIINGNLNISGTLTMGNVAGNDLYLSGNWTRTGTFTANNRAVYLTGGNSTITATGGQSFPFLRIQKSTSANTITLNNPVTITNEVSFTTGVVVSSSTNLFIMENGSALNTTNSGSTSSFVAGPMRKIGHTGATGSSAFTFPVGKIVSGVNHYRFIGIGAGGGTSDIYTAEFQRENSYNNGRTISAVATGDGLQRVSKCEHWDLTRTGANVPVTLSWTSQSPCNVGYVNEFASLRVVQFNGTQWGDTFGNNGTTGSLTPGGGSITWNGATVFNKFTLGSVSLSMNPLPFNLLAFNGRSRTNDIELSFTVKGNDEQDQYIIERSTDGRSFTNLTGIEATQNLTEADYTVYDEQPQSGWNFYRLTAVDMAGNKKQSNIIRVWFGSRGGKPAVYPNPMQGNTIQLFTGGLPKGTYNIQLRAQDGKLLLSRMWVYDGVAPVYSIATDAALAAGMYWLSITAPHQPPVSIKVIK